MPCKGQVEGDPAPFTYLYFTLVHFQTKIAQKMLSTLLHHFLKQSIKNRLISYFALAKIIATGARKTSSKKMSPKQYHQQTTNWLDSKWMTLCFLFHDAVRFLKNLDLSTHKSFALEFDTIASASHDWVTHLLGLRSCDLLCRSFQSSKCLLYCSSYKMMIKLSLPLFRISKPFSFLLGV